MFIHHANDREPVERAVALPLQSRCLLDTHNLLMIHCLFPVILEHHRVRGSGQCGDTAEKSLDPRHPPLQQVQSPLSSH